VDDHDVVVLTDKTLESYVSDKELMLVEFYAPWCGHCKHLAPEYAEAATVLKKDGVELAKVDATAETASASKYGVSGYPTLKIFRNGVASDYNGPRTASGIINYMKKQVGPASKELNTVEEAEKMFSLDEVIITGFFVSKSGSDHRTFIALANALRDKFKFAYTNSEALLSHYGYRNAVVMFKPYDEKRLVYHGSMTQSAITEWIYGSNLPLAGVLTKANSELYQRKGKAILKLLVDVDLKTNKKQADYYLNRLRKVAKDYSDISFTVADRKEFTEDKDRYGFSGLVFFPLYFSLY
jgi:protein disulfide isomerase